MRILQQRHRTQGPPFLSSLNPSDDAIICRALTLDPAPQLLYQWLASLVLLLLQVRSTNVSSKVNQVVLSVLSHPFPFPSNPPFKTHKLLSPSRALCTFHSFLHSSQLSQYCRSLSRFPASTSAVVTPAYGASALQALPLLSVPRQIPDEPLLAAPLKHCPASKSDNLQLQFSRLSFSFRLVRLRRDSFFLAFFSFSLIPLCARGTSRIFTVSIVRVVAYDFELPQHWDPVSIPRFSTQRTSNWRSNTGSGEQHQLPPSWCLFSASNLGAKRRSKYTNSQLLAVPSIMSTVLTCNVRQ